MLLQTGVAANVDASFENGVNGPVIFAAGPVEIPVLEADFGGLEIGVRAFDHSLNFQIAMRLFGGYVGIGATPLSVYR
jgi:hypothetical protein